ncbi:hypothetical protein [Zavarzinia sp. CC-PAN008]|uniref:hypothetical protein n=1 Tax=Zavarzinia sp. CC-PAN008 TaxID=3243332 RepID=UPI003F74A89C
MDDLDAARKVREALVGYRRKLLHNMAVAPACGSRGALTSAIALREVQADIEMLDRIIAEEEDSMGRATAIGMAHATHYSAHPV